MRLLSLLFALVATTALAAPSVTGPVIGGEDTAFGWDTDSPPNRVLDAWMLYDGDYLWLSPGVSTEAVYTHSIEDAQDGIISINDTATTRSLYPHLDSTDDVGDEGLSYAVGNFDTLNTDLLYSFADDVINVEDDLFIEGAASVGTLAPDNYNQFTVVRQASTRPSRGWFGQHTFLPGWGVSPSGNQVQGGDFLLIYRPTPIFAIDTYINEDTAALRVTNQYESTTPYHPSGEVFAAGSTAYGLLAQIEEGMFVDDWASTPRWIANAGILPSGLTSSDFATAIYGSINGTSAAFGSGLYAGYFDGPVNVTSLSIGGTDAYIWRTFNADSGTTSANSYQDTLTVAGSGIASTAISGDTLTVTATEVDGSTTNETPLLAADADTLLGVSGRTLSLDSQTANYVFAGPTSGGAADPAFRALVDNDIPNNITITEADTLATVTGRGATTTTPTTFNTTLTAATAEVTAALLLGGNPLYVDGDDEVAATWNAGDETFDFGMSIAPTVDSSRDLGQNTRRWLHTYSDDHIGTTATLSGHLTAASASVTAFSAGSGGYVHGTGNGAWLTVNPAATDSNEVPAIVLSGPAGSISIVGGTALVECDLRPSNNNEEDLGDSAHLWDTFWTDEIYSSTRMTIRPWLEGEESVVAVQSSWELGRSGEPDFGVIYSTHIDMPNYDWVDSQVADALTISGGTVNSTTVGASTPSSGAFTTLGATGNATIGDADGDEATVTGDLAVVDTEWTDFFASSWSMPDLDQIAEFDWSYSELAWTATGTNEVAEVWMPINLADGSILTQIRLKVKCSNTTLLDNLYLQVIRRDASSAADAGATVASNDFKASMSTSFQVLTYDMADTATLADNAYELRLYIQGDTGVVVTVREVGFETSRREY